MALGVYGVLAYTVAQQTREIAIRLALGGERGDVVRMVLRLGMRMVAVGLGIGVAMSVVTNRLLQSELWGTTPTDPTTFAAAILVTLAIGWSLPSSRRGARCASSRWLPSGTNSAFGCVACPTLCRFVGQHRPSSVLAQMGVLTVSSTKRSRDGLRRNDCLS